MTSCPHTQHLTIAQQNMSNAVLPIELKELEGNIIQLLEKAKERERDKLLIKIGQVSSQVAHDIRSPLAALEMVIGDAGELPEEQRLMVRDAVTRIGDIANNLLNKSKADFLQADAKTSVLLSSAIDGLISEKRLQLRNKPNITIEYIPSSLSYGLFSHINNTEFKRILSNLINNAAEAMKEKGSIIVTLKEVSKSALISIQDNGRGMSQELLEKLGQRGVTHDKAEGSGLGVAHAVDTLLEWRGKIKFDSQLGKGTTVNIALPLCARPRWFLEKLVIPKKSQLLILDDDISIHRVWDMRFDHLSLTKHNIIRSDFQNGEELRVWLKEHVLKPPYVILCDYEIIGAHENGLDILEQLHLNKNAVLVTSRYEQLELQERCEKLGVKLLPKLLAPLVPIEIFDT